MDLYSLWIYSPTPPALQAHISQPTRALAFPVLSMDVTTYNNSPESRLIDLREARAVFQNSIQGE